jgi:hypothetical protein
MWKCYEKKMNEYKDLGLSEEDYTFIDITIYNAHIFCGEKCIFDECSTPSGPLPSVETSPPKIEGLWTRLLKFLHLR